MRVCFDISAALGQGAGIGRYARELALALHALPGGPALTLLHNRQPLERLPLALRGLPRFDVPLGDRAWRALMLGPRLPQLWRTAIEACDLYHGADMVAPYLARPLVVTIHDLSTLRYPQHHTLPHRLYLRLALPLMARRAAAIITDAASTRDEIVARLRAPPERVHAIHLGVDHARFTPRPPCRARERVAVALGIDSPYILAVGTLEPRKNLPALLRAYARLGSAAPMLVIVGGQGWGKQSLPALAGQLGLDGRVRFVGHAPEALLPDLYAGAELFVYPSLYEGFGLPALEALACGAPVITSATSSLPEVVGDAAVLVDPTSTAALAAGMRRALENAQLRDELRARGPRRAAQFTWERTARETLGVYEAVLAQGLGARDQGSGVGDQGSGVIEL